MNESVIFFCCHFLNQNIIKTFKKLKHDCGSSYDVILLYNNTDHSYESFGDENVYLFDLANIKSLGFGFWRDNVWCHADYPLIHFYRANKNYKYYWRIEYDVRFTGNWRSFFDSFLASQADLLGTYLRDMDADQNWPWWNGSTLKADNLKLYTIFFPVVRFSGEALNTLDNCYQAGDYGYSELIVPTILKSRGMNVQDIGSKFYDFLSFNFEGLIIPRPQKLLHPIRKMPFKKRLIGTMRGFTKGRIP